MSTPMYDLPEHLLMGLNVNGDGPVDEDDPEFLEWGCWCDQGARCPVFLSGRLTPEHPRG